ncbi:MAG: ATP-dependent DNA helicase RecG [Verrucomicrobia bacterium]|jgi:ATP-dependent DNA helicase RecG|nr:ATP-dependent DNA helicase RecG [Verrucomicrobiota bacterium]
MAAAPAQPSARPPDRPVTALWGVGAERAAQLARLEIRTVGDLLLHRPRRYEDRRQFRPLAQLSTAEAALTRGTVAAMGVKTLRRRAKSVFELVLEDGTARLHCRWWNLPFMENYFAVGDDVLVFGKLTGLKPRTMDHPETEVVEAGEESSIHMGRIVPVYPLTEGLPQRWLRGLIWRTLQRTGPASSLSSDSPAAGEGRSAAQQIAPVKITRGSSAPLPELAAEPWVEAVPAGPANPTPSVGTGTRPVPREQAIHMLHCPETLEDAERARQRLALDEFIVLQREIRARRLRFEAKARGLPCRGDNHLIKPFLAQLGFVLTDAQTRVLREIREDLGGAHPMRRLLQGDVGSGKTAVAACTALMALESGFHVVLMAPTEILADQHFRNFTRWFEPLGVTVELQTGSRKGASPERSELADRGSGALVIGTHALIESGFAVPRLGLVIIDEQHKFGVEQREQLLRKGHYPHLLVMTATPIPRTLGLTLYGDLDVSVIDRLPAGRGRVRTFVRPADRLPKVWEFVRTQLEAGRQAYVVYPRVEDTAGGTTKAVLREYERIEAALAPHQAGLLHGRLKAGERERVMTGFRTGSIGVLVATSLVEVGVDVPNATVMVIENAEQFGLAQLHQLRGRIGRGAHESHCILVSEAKTPEVRERLRVLEDTTDGFRIAEADLKLRGPGELLGQQQSGAPRFRFADLTQDLGLVQQARELVALDAFP